MKNREFREIQVSSTQLAVIFLGILVIGVVIFLLGVSVGKKHAQVAQKANVIAQKEPEQVKEKLVTLPQVKSMPETIGEEAEKPAPAESTPAKTTFVPKTPAEKPALTTSPAESQKYRKMGYPVIVMEPQITDKKPVFRVRVGGFATREQAEAAREKLSSGTGRKTDFFIVRD
jgi:cell division septation protein DedD